MGDQVLGERSLGLIHVELSRVRERFSSAESIADIEIELIGKTMIRATGGIQWHFL